MLCFADKPSLIVDPPALEKLIENTSTQVCCQGNSNPPMGSDQMEGESELFSCQ